MKKQKSIPKQYKSPQMKNVKQRVKFLVRENIQDYLSGDLFAEETGKTD